MQQSLNVCVYDVSNYNVLRVSNSKTLKNIHYKEETIRGEKGRGRKRKTKQHQGLIITIGLEALVDDNSDHSLMYVCIENSFIGLV